jgi:Fur family zinc uptake transcriptional regulator
MSVFSHKPHHHDHDAERFVSEVVRASRERGLRLNPLRK